VRVGLVGKMAQQVDTNAAVGSGDRDVHVPSDRVRPD
jgi:hypothetical protein